MRNPALFNALVAAQGAESVKLADEGQLGAYTIEKVEMQNSIGQPVVYGRMDPWGEKIVCNCPNPACNDRGMHLAICYRWGTSIPHPTRKTARVYFSRYHFNCWKCGSSGKPVIARWLAQLKLPPGYETNAVVDTAEVPLKMQTSLRMLIEEVKMPNPSYNLSDTCRTPQRVRDWLYNVRGFDPYDLECNYGIRYVPVGTPYMLNADNTMKLTWDDRILIPIIQHRKQISWQLRAANDESNAKYLGRPNHPDWVPKGMWLYNFDEALMYQTIVIFEGVTNVWRFGPASIALFGKSLSGSQADLMRRVWGFDGKGIICLDEDTWNMKKVRDPETEAETWVPIEKDKQGDRKVALMLLQCKSFANGVAIIRLRNGDAAQHDQRRLHYLYRIACTMAVTDPEKLDNAILDEANVGPIPDNYDVMPPYFVENTASLLQKQNLSLDDVYTDEEAEDEPDAIMVEDEEEEP